MAVGTVTGVPGTQAEKCKGTWFPTREAPFAFEARPFGAR